MMVIKFSLFKESLGMDYISGVVSGYIHAFLEYGDGDDGILQQETNYVGIYTEQDISSITRDKIEYLVGYIFKSLDSDEVSEVRRNVAAASLGMMLFEESYGLGHDTEYGLSTYLKSRLKELCKYLIFGDVYINDSNEIEIRFVTDFTINDIDILD